ncbi:mercury transport protein (plasmid) [Streptomyces sp. L7]|uniref:cytochrome c biogenesis CcdA family protein n=2 Tax=Actinomycetes TaxID=1760 RepID=UPI003D44C5D4
MGALLVLAFGAGMLAPVNPCGFAVLPAFLAYGTGTTGSTRGVWGRLAGGLRSGLALTLGYTGTFTIFGLLLAAGMHLLVGVIPWLAAALGAIFALLGLAMLIGLRISLGLNFLGSVGRNRKQGGMIAFGVGYALASASCSLALLLAVVTQALTGTGWATVLLVFAAYAAGSAVLLVTLSVVTAFASTVISTYLRRLLPHMTRITGAVLAASGVYLLIYWLPQLLGGAPGVSILTGISGSMSVWIGSNQPVVVTGGGVLIAAVLVGVVWHRIASRPDGSGDPQDDDCCPAPEEPDTGTRQAQR